MNSSITIRLASNQDNNLLAQLGSKTFEQAFAADNTPEDMATFLAKTFSPTIQAAELADPQNVIWLVYVDEVCIGYVKMFTGLPATCIANSRALKVSRLYLLQEWCGYGFGSELLYRVTDYGREQGFGSIWLTVWEHNTRALALYQKLGFKIVGDEDFILGQDVQHDFIMEKVLG